MPGVIIIEGHVQGLSNVRSIGEMGIPVIVVDRNNCIARYSKYCKAFFKCPPFYSDEFAAFLINLAKNENLKDWLLIPSNDHAVHTLSKHKEKIQAIYKTFVPDFNELPNIYDKKKLLDIASKNGVAIPRTVVFQNPSEKHFNEQEFPIMTKGRNGLTFYKKTGKKAFISKNSAELKIQLEALSKKVPIQNCLNQEVIPYNSEHKTISFTCFSVNGEIKSQWSGVKLREHPLRFGTATYTMSIDSSPFQNQSMTLIKALNYSGVCEIEYLYDERSKEYKLIEINPRTWLWVGLAKACGIDYAKMMYAHAHNQPIKYPDTYPTEKKWINHITDLPFSIKGTLKREYSVYQVLKSYCTKREFAIFKARDPLPFLSFIFLLPLLIIKR